MKVFISVYFICLLWAAVACDFCGNFECGTEDLCCNDAYIGPRCYSPETSSCVNGVRLCGKEDGACGSTCFDPSLYHCSSDGQLLQGSSSSSCPAGNSVCGDGCYDTNTQECCNDNIYDKGTTMCSVEFGTTAPTYNTPFWYFTAQPKGALIEVTYNSTVGVLLDDVPTEYGFRERVAQYYLNQPESFWAAKAVLQGQMLENKQVFRVYYTSDGWYDPPFGGDRALTVPPENLWQFNFDKVQRIDINGHDYVAVNFTFYGVLVTADIHENFLLSDITLETIGGIVWMDWQAPVEPDYLFQRTGYACVDEYDFTWDNNVDSENLWIYFDDTCDVEAPVNPDNASFLHWDIRCHYTGFPNYSCVDALNLFVGAVHVNMTWTRIEWDDTIANEWRYGVNTPGIVDLQSYKNSALDNKIVYAYIKEGACALHEGCVPHYGWRRLLHFGSSSINVGGIDAVEGFVYLPQLQETNWFSYSQCHHHAHNNYFLNFSVAHQPGEKKGFCMESTWRYHNNEYTPLATYFDTCWYQGVSPGWGDDYFAGIPCQWKDITEGVPSGTVPLTQTDNPFGFLCEGVPVLNETTNEILYELSGYINSSGDAVMKQQCNQSLLWNSNNIETIFVTVAPRGSYVTSPCTNGQFGAIRNCGFSLQQDMITCQPNETVSLTVSINTPESPQVLRVCESSIALGLSTYCAYTDALASTTIVDATQTISFTCPAARDDTEIGGYYSLLVAPYFPLDTAVAVNVDGKGVGCDL